MKSSALAFVSLVVALSASAGPPAGLADMKRRAAAGDSSAALAVAGLYEQGREVQRDPAEAVRYYEIAARAGDADAQLALGLILSGAEPSVSRDPAVSAAWFRKSALQGNGRAQYFLGLALESETSEEGEGSKGEDNQLEAFEWYRRSAGTGDADAMLAMARLYAEGGALRVDLAKAHAWNSLAATWGVPEGLERARELEARMSAEQIAEAERAATRLAPRYGGSIPAAAP